VKYPGSGCTPPWAKLFKSPDHFFDSEDVPEVDDDDGLRKMTLQDPSRMKNHELNACLQLWQECQKETKYSFTFHHWWSEGQKGYVQRMEPKPLDTDEEGHAEAADTLTGTVTRNGLCKKRKAGKDKKPKKTTKHGMTSDVQATHPENLDNVIQNGKSESPAYSLPMPTKSGQPEDAYGKITMLPPNESGEDMVQPTFFPYNPLPQVCIFLFKECI
jgi:hypothetical protein